MDYSKQANNFCTKNNIVITKTFLDCNYHLEEDKEKRNIYYIKIVNTVTNESMSFNFGDSIVNTKARYRISPSNYSILACLTKYNPGNFKDFCMDYGFDNDSIKALKSYKLVIKEWEDVARVFLNCLDELTEIV